MPIPLVLGVMGTTEWAVIGGIVVLLFGASKLPELARSMGLAQKEYHQAKQEAQEEIRRAEASAPATGEDDLEQAAAALGIDTEGKSPEELREAIRDRTN